MKLEHTFEYNSIYYTAITLFTLLLVSFRIHAESESQFVCVMFPESNGFIWHFDQATHNAVGLGVSDSMVRCLTFA